MCGWVIHPKGIEHRFIFDFNSHTDGLMCVMLICEPVSTFKSQTIKLIKLYIVQTPLAPISILTNDAHHLFGLSELKMLLPVG